MFGFAQAIGSLLKPRGWWLNNVTFADNGGFGYLFNIGIVRFGFMLNRFNNGNGSGFLRRFFDTFDDFFWKNILYTLTRNDLRISFRVDLT